MKNILLINGGSKSFGQDFRMSCQDNDINCISFRSGKHLLILAKQGSVDLYVHNKKLSLADIGYAFIRVRGNYSQITSLLATVFTLHHIPFNDMVNSHHTENIEKTFQSIRFATHNIPIPKTILTTKDGLYANKEILTREISFPCVMKINGSKGEKVWKINSLAHLDEHFTTHINDEKVVLILQEYIPNSHDIRALYFENKIIGAIERHSTDGFYNNVARGGKTVVTSLTKHEDILCQKALQALDIDFGGIDFIRTDTGIIFWEINIGPQIHGFQNATNINVPDILVQKIKQRYL